MKAKRKSDVAKGADDGSAGLKTILVPIDFSLACLEAIPWAKLIAGANGGTIHLLHVHGPEYPLPIGVIPPATRSRTEIEKCVLNYLKQFAIEYHLTGIAPHFHVTTGTAFHEIGRVAGAIDADVIVTSTHGRTGWKHALLGSTAEKLARHAPCPVLVARHPSTGRVRSPSIGHIVFPFDFSKPSIKGLETAVHYADRFHAALTLLHVVTPNQFVVPQGALAYATPELRERAVKDSRTRLRDFCLAHYFKDVPVKVAVRAGAPAVEICKFTQRTAADLIVIPTHGRAGLSHALLGSVAEHVVRYADGPVLVVPTRRGAKL